MGSDRTSSVSKYELLAYTIMSQSFELDVVIMAGGLGKRMESDLPKVLHEVGGKPMLVRVLEQAMQLSPTKIILIVGKYRSIIESTIRAYVDLEKVEFVLQEVALGTGHAVQCALDSLKRTPDHKVLILSGDVPLIRSSTMKQISEMEERAVVLATTVENPTGYGRIVFDEEGKFRRIVEEKECTEEERRINMINTGVYCIQSKLLCDYLPKITAENAQKEYYLTDVLELIKKGEGEPIGTCVLSRDRNMEVLGVNTKAQLAELEKYL